ncbi:MAG: FAD binding domain-containing protein, partial [Polyangiaceae bacterium]
MIPAAFGYSRPRSLEEAFALLSEHGTEGKLLAGGHSLIPMMKLRLAAPSMLIDISRIAGLDGIKAAGAGLTIGALATHAAIAASAAVATIAPALGDAAGQIGDSQVRNRGTIGGSCAHGDPSADYPAVMLALDAIFTTQSLKGTKTIRAPEFFQGMFETALEHNAVLTQIEIASAPKSAYVKFPHPASHYAVVGVACNLKLKGPQIAEARVAVTGVGDSAFRAANVERALLGVDAGDKAAIEAACVDAAAGVEGRGDVFASANYRRAMTDVY